MPFIGEQLAADARLLEANDLEMDEATLTGEAELSKKDASNEVLPESTKMSELMQCIYSHYL